MSFKGVNALAQRGDEIPLADGEAEATPNCRRFAQQNRPAGGRAKLTPALN